MAEVRWKLKETLEHNQTNPYALARAMGDQSKAVTLYRLTSPTKKTSRIDLGTLSEIITALREVTGKAIEITDLLEYAPEPNQAHAPALHPAEDLDALLDSSTADLADALDELEADLPPQEKEAWLGAFAGTSK